MARHNPEEYERAKSAIRHYLRGGSWRASRDIHERLAEEVPKDWLFGAIKKELGFEDRRIDGRFYWRLPE